MATLAQASLPKLARIALRKKRDNFLENLAPRFCMVISTGIILAGLGIPALILIQILPASLLLCIAGLTLVAFGGTMWLTFYGDL
jgi:cytochrome c biogenesis protein CcdA